MLVCHCLAISDRRISQVLAAGARQAGVEVELQVFPRMQHCFFQWADFLPQARQAFTDVGAFADEIAWAEAVLAAATIGGVSTLSSGDLVDAAMVGRAERVLALVRATS